jgi:hypothetical protein
MRSVRRTPSVAAGAEPVSVIVNDAIGLILRQLEARITSRQRATDATERLSPDDVGCLCARLAALRALAMNPRLGHAEQS